MTKLNILPVPTFSRLGVNYAERETGSTDTKSIEVPAGTEQQIIQFTDSDCRTSVDVGRSAGLKLIQVFADRQSRVSELDVSLDDNAAFGLIQLYLGGSTVSGVIIKLNGHRASFSADIGYDLGKGEALDLNLVSEHHGVRTTSEINVNGVLRAGSQKTFKGTIDFKNGSSGSKGSEKEDVFLMDEDVVNKTVPVILCAEEDVDGSHGATIGRIDGQHIRYMQSRGIPEEKIYELITRARIRHIIGKIGDEQAVKRVYDALGWGEDDEL